MWTTSSKERGNRIERDFSRVCHAEGTPVLVSPLILRECGAGQIDFCRINKGVVEVIELKSNFPMAPRQRRRLRTSLVFLEAIFKRPVFLHEAFAKR